MNLFNCIISYVTYVIIISSLFGEMMSTTVFVTMHMIVHLKHDYYLKREQSFDINYTYLPGIFGEIMKNTI